MCCGAASPLWSAVILDGGLSFSVRLSGNRGYVALRHLCRLVSSAMLGYLVSPVVMILPFLSLLVGVVFLFYRPESWGSHQGVGQ